MGRIGIWDEVTYEMKWYMVLIGCMGCSGGTGCSGR